MAKIAVEFEPISAPRLPGAMPARPASRVLARGEGWSVSDVACSAGPHDRPFEEQHAEVCIALVVEGSFQYESSAGRELMTPGSLMLGNAGQYFECGHEHGVGDRCISFAYEPKYFEGLAAEGHAGSRSARFSLLRVPPVREFSRLVARACAAVARSAERARSREGRSFLTREKAAGNGLEAPNHRSAGVAEWEEMGVELAARTLEMASGGGPNRMSSAAAEARVTRVVRMIESRLDVQNGLSALAQEAKLSRYHFLRVFQQLTGLTPHRYIRRTRLRQAATRLLLESSHVVDIALDSGFGDVSNFNHAFRDEFGVSPRAYRKLTGGLE